MRWSQCTGSYGALKTEHERTKEEAKYWREEAGRLQAQAESLQRDNERLRAAVGALSGPAPVSQPSSHPVARSGYGPGFGAGGGYPAMPVARAESSFGHVDHLAYQAPAARGFLGHSRGAPRGFGRAGRGGLSRAAPSGAHGSRYTARAKEEKKEEAVERKQKDGEERKPADPLKPQGDSGVQKVNNKTRKEKERKRRRAAEKRETKEREGGVEEAEKDVVMREEGQQRPSTFLTQDRPDIPAQVQPQLEQQEEEQRRQQQQQQLEEEEQRQQQQQQQDLPLRPRSNSGWADAVEEELEGAKEAKGALEEFAELDIDLFQ